jgi:hypothetical protein
VVVMVVLSNCSNYVWCMSYRASNIYVCKTD